MLEFDKTIRAGDTNGYFLVFVATDDENLYLVAANFEECYSGGRRL